MKNSFLAAVFLLSTSAFAENVTLHIWQGNVYSDIDGQADWNVKVNAFVASSETMADLKQKYLECEIYANSRGFFGSIAGYFRWQYQVVTQDIAIDAVERNIFFLPKDASEAGGNNIESKSEEVSVEVGTGLSEGPNGEFIFHANEKLRLGYYYYKRGTRELINAETGRAPELKDFSR